MNPRGIAPAEPIDPMNLHRSNQPHPEPFDLFNAHLSKPPNLSNL